MSIFSSIKDAIFGHEAKVAAPAAAPPKPAAASGIPANPANANWPLWVWCRSCRERVTGAGCWRRPFCLPGATVLPAFTSTPAHWTIRRRFQPIAAPVSQPTNVRWSAFPIRVCSESCRATARLRCRCWVRTHRSIRHRTIARKRVPA